MIAEGLAARCPTPVVGEPLPPGDSLRVVTLAGPGRCNDGTPPKLFVRAASDPAHAHDWVWFFDGGSRCLGNEDCAVRWCGEAWPFGKRHMSSDPLPLGIGGDGITSLLEENGFATWNQVFAAYCTSDRWLGTRADVVLDGENPYRLHFEGALVAADGIAAGAAGLTSDDGTVTLPPLGDAATILVAGTSGGCQGAASTTDTFRAVAPGAAITTALDSCFDPAAEVIEPALYAEMDESEARLFLDGLVGVQGARPAPACMADHPHDPWLCINMDVMARFYLDPVFVHHDQSDPVIYPNVESFGVSKAGFAQMAIDTFALYRTSAPHVSVHSNNCGWHTSIDEDGPFLRATVVDATDGGPPWTEHGALAQALTGDQTVVVEGSPATTSVCSE